MWRPTTKKKSTRTAGKPDTAMKIIFMGTPDIAARILAALDDSRHEVVLAVSQPDRPAGRKHVLTPPPVKTEAQKRGIPVFQPEHVTDPGAAEELGRHAPDVIVAAAYGQVLPGVILGLARYGCVNVHASLLPKYRGAAPVQRAIIDGCTQTGVTIMQMDEGLDTGDIILSEKIPIADDDTAATLFVKMAEVSGPVLLRALDMIEDGTAERIPQTGESNYAAMLTRDTGRIDWTLSARMADCLIRGVTPEPGAWTTLGGRKLKILKAVRADVPAGSPGEVMEAPSGVLRVSCADGCLDILTLQPEGKKAMAAADYLRGSKAAPGTVLGDQT